MRDELKDRAISLLKDTYAIGYEDGVKATNVDCGVVWEERIDDIKTEILDKYLNGDGTVGNIRAWKLDELIKLIDKHIGGEQCITITKTEM